MYFRNLLLGSAALVPLLAARPALAQRVQADIRIGGGPIAGRVIIGDPYGYRYRPREAYLPVRRIYVERVRFRDRGRREGWFKKFRRGARAVVVFYDRRDDCFYDRYRPGYREIEVFERDGRYYWPDEDRYYDDRYYDDRYDSRYDGRYDGRYDDRYDGRYDDRYDSRRDGRYDGRYDDRNRPDDDRNRRDRGGNWDH